MCYVARRYLLYIFSPLIDCVILSDLNLEQIIVSHESRQFCCTLPAAASNSCNCNWIYSSLLQRTVLLSKIMRSRTWKLKALDRRVQLLIANISWWLTNGRTDRRYQISLALRPIITNSRFDFLHLSEYSILMPQRPCSFQRCAFSKKQAFNFIYLSMQFTCKQCMSIVLFKHTTHSGDVLDGKFKHHKWHWSFGNWIIFIQVTETC